MSYWYVGTSFLVIAVLIIQSIGIYKVHNSNVKRLRIPKSNKGSKEWNDFIDLFKEGKIKSNGYVVIYASNGEEEMMLHFNCMGNSHDYFKDNYILISAYFEYSGYNEEGDPGRFASYDLVIDDIVCVTEIKEGGTYRDDDYNFYFVDCLLKDGKTIELNFSYKEESANGNG